MAARHGRQADVAAKRPPWPPAALVALATLPPDQLGQGLAGTAGRGRAGQCRAGHGTAGQGQDTARNVGKHKANVVRFHANDRNSLKLPWKTQGEMIGVSAPRKASKPITKLGIFEVRIHLSKTLENMRWI